MATRDAWSTREAADVVGITFRQADYWDRTNLIRPSLHRAGGSGSRRGYSYDDLLRLRLIVGLTAGGLKLEAVRTILPRLARYPLDAGGIVVIAQGVIGVMSEGAALQAVSGRSLVFMLPCSSIVEYVERRITEIDAAQAAQQKEVPLWQR